MFAEIADEIFSKAGVPKEGNEQLWEQARDILAEKMAVLSVTYGLSYKRVRLFEKQKQALVDDLLIFKNAETKQKH